MEKTARGIVTDWLAQTSEERAGSIHQMQAELSTLSIEQGAVSDELSGMLTLRVYEATHSGNEWTPEQLADCLTELINGDAELANA